MDLAAPLPLLDSRGWWCADEIKPPSTDQFKRYAEDVNRWWITIWKNRFCNQRIGPFMKCLFVPFSRDCATDLFIVITISKPIIPPLWFWILIHASYSGLKTDCAKQYWSTVNWFWICCKTTGYFKTMSTIYLVRYGQASFGAASYDQLSAKGEQQAQVVGDF